MAVAINASIRSRWTAEMTGPTMVSFSVGSPTLRCPDMVARPSRIRSKRLRCTTARVGAVQIWPEWKVQVDPMQVMAALTSASSSTTQAPLPPSSSSRRFMVFPEASMIRVPTCVEPVKLIMSTSAESTRAAAGSGPAAVTRLTTPGGKPTSSRMRASSTMARGSWGAGFITTVLPAARAGATLPAMLTSGKLNEVTQATTPTGRRLTIPPMMPPGASGVAPTAWGSSGVCRTHVGSWA